MQTTPVMAYQASPFPQPPSKYNAPCSGPVTTVPHNSPYLHGSVDRHQQKRLESYHMSEEYCQNAMNSVYSKAEDFAVETYSDIRRGWLLAYGVVSFALGGASMTAAFAGLTVALVGAPVLYTVGILGVSCGVRALQLYLRGDLELCDQHTEDATTKKKNLEERTDQASKKLKESFAALAGVDKDLNERGDSEVERQALRIRKQHNLDEISRREQTLWKSSPQKLPCNLRSSAAYLAQWCQATGPVAGVLARRGQQACQYDQALNWHSAQKQAEYLMGQVEEDELLDESPDDASIRQKLDEQTQGLFSARERDAFYRAHGENQRLYRQHERTTLRTYNNVMADRHYLEQQSRFGRLRAWWRGL